MTLYNSIITLQYCLCRLTNVIRAGLKHVWGVRPNRVADFRGPPFWTLQRTRNAATRCVLRAYNAAECDCSRTPLGKLTGSPRPIAGFKEALAAGRGRGKGGKWKGGEGEGRKEKGRKGGERKGRLTLMHSWITAADWLRPALNDINIRKVTKDYRFLTVLLRNRVIWML